MPNCKKNCICCNIEVTSERFLYLAENSQLKKCQTYKITDIQNGLYVKTLSGSTYDRNTLLSLNCPKTYDTTTVDGNVWKGIWRSSKTANVNDLFIWGGVVWKNKTGNIGSATDVVTLDSTNWEYIDRNNFSNNEYVPLLLKCQYDFEEAWVNLLADDHGNIIGVDWHLNQIYGLTSERTDWNCMTKPNVIFSNNQLYGVYNNLQNVIDNRTNGYIYNNDGNVFDNKFVSEIANNEQDVYENIAADYDIVGAVNEVFYVNGSTFYFTHDFATSPLNSGSSLFYNYIPQGARITSIQAIGNSLTGGGGATLTFGLESDAANLIAADTLANVNSGKTYSGFSTAATANRSLEITAGVANVTGGTLTVKVEFIL